MYPFWMHVLICQSNLGLIQDTKLITSEKMKAHLLNDQEKFYSV